MKIKLVKKVWKGYSFLGCYDYLNNAIRIKDNIKLKDKIDTFLHEYIHYLIYKFRLGREFDYVFDIICALLDKRYRKRKIKEFKFLTKYYFN